jgi:predicted alpha/beta hydrolase family esterase
LCDEPKKKARFSQGFDKTICSRCPRLPDCLVKSGTGHYYLRYNEKTMRLARRRQQENTTAFKDRYRWRAGVEATMSQYDRLTGVKHMRVRGFTAVRFAAVLKAAGVNLARAVAVRRARRRANSSSDGQHLSLYTCMKLFKERLEQVFGC